jgi:hypothetical protein
MNRDKFINLDVANQPGSLQYQKESIAANETSNNKNERERVRTQMAAAIRKRQNWNNEKVTIINNMNVI